MIDAMDIKALHDHADAISRMKPVMVVPCPDPRAAELVALFSKADERGKHCMIAMARAMPCMRGNV